MAQVFALTLDMDAIHKSLLPSSEDIVQSVEAINLKHKVSVALPSEPAR